MVKKKIKPLLVLVYHCLLITPLGSSDISSKSTEDIIKN